MLALNGGWVLVLLVCHSVDLFHFLLAFLISLNNALPSYGDGIDLKDMRPASSQTVVSAVERLKVETTASKLIRGVFH